MWKCIQLTLKPVITTVLPHTQSSTVELVNGGTLTEVIETSFNLKKNIVTVYP
jgi:hypothetical protein